MGKLTDFIKHKLKPGNAEVNDLIEITNAIVFDAKADISDKSVISLPISQLAALGAGAASLLPAFRTVTQTSAANLTGYYKLANAAVGDTLKVAKNGNFWGAFKTAEGGSKFAQLQAADPFAVTTSTVMPIDLSQACARHSANGSKKHDFI